MICINKNSVNDVNKHIDQLTFFFLFYVFKANARLQILSSPLYY